MRLYGTGYHVLKIIGICGCHPTSLSEWVRAYRERGLSTNLDHRQSSNRARLTRAQVEAMQNQLHG